MSEKIRYVRIDIAISILIMMLPSSFAATKRHPARAIAAGMAVGVLGGLVGLGGAEFRLPMLIGIFGFTALHAVILNKAMSLAVVSSALVFRTAVVPMTEIVSHWTIVATLLAGSLIGAWMGAAWATRMRGRRLYQVLSILLVLIGAVLILGHGRAVEGAVLAGPWVWVGGVVAGFGIGVVASLMGVAGGELLIPTLILLFSTDIKLAGSLSLAVSLPTMLVGFARYSRDGALQVLLANRAFVLLMAAGSVAGTAIGAQFLGVVPDDILLPALALILLISAYKVWHHC
jgi:uncharacterized protein